MANNKTIYTHTHTHKFYCPTFSSLMPNNCCTTYEINYIYRDNVDYLPSGIQFLSINRNKVNMLPYTVRYLYIFCHIYYLDKLPSNLQMINTYINDKTYNLPPLLKYIYNITHTNYKQVTYLTMHFHRLKKLILSICTVETL